MFKFLGSTRAVIAAVAVFSALLILLIWNQLLRQLDRERADTISAAVYRNSNLVVSLEQYAIRTIRNADAVLQLVKMEYEKKGWDVDYSLLHTGIIDTNYFYGVAVIDEEGLMQSSNILTAPMGMHFEDRAYFAFHQSNRDQLYISKPIMSRTISRAVIVLSRRLERKDGSFAGVVAVQIEPSTFTQFYSKADLGENDLMSLISPDGITYARRRGKWESYGENISKSPLFRHVAKDPIASYYAKDAIRNIPSYFSYRKLEGYPVIATVGTAEHDILAGYYARARRDYLFGTVITVLLVFFTILIIGILIQRKNVTRRIRISENRYRSVFENSKDAIVVVRPDGTVEAMNPATGCMFQLDRSADVKKSFTQLYAGVLPGIRMTKEGAGIEHSVREEVVFTRMNGSVFTAETVYSAYQDFEGEDRFVVLIRDITLQKEMEQRLVQEQKRYQRRLTQQIILAQERERESIGHEMHDNINQILTSTKLYLEMAVANPPLREALLPKSIDMIMDCITEIRNLSRELSAPTLGTQSLIDSITELVETVSSSSRVSILFHHENFHTLLVKDQKLAFYRILQEQLTNISKHAAATEVTISLSQHHGTTELRICDNGKGFDVEAKRKGIGLNNILSRTKVLGGEMLLDSKPGKGTILKVLIPIVAAGKEQNGQCPQAAK